MHRPFIALALLVGLSSCAPSYIHHARSSIKRPELPAFALRAVVSSPERSPVS
jgi:hypothetical protein